MSEFIAFLIDGLQPLGQIRAKRMFGGHGIFFEDTMFAIVADDTLYLKADEQNKSEFDALDLMPFQYSRKDKVIEMSYRPAPEVIFDDPDELIHWGRLALDAALRQRR